MSRFMAGGSGLSLETVDRLCELLKLRIVTDQKQKRTVKHGIDRTLRQREALR